MQSPPNVIVVPRWHSNEVTLSAVTPDDRENLHRWKQDKTLVAQYHGVYAEVTLDDIDAWISANTSNPNHRMWAIRPETDGPAIGIVRLMFIDWEAKTAEVGIFIGDSSQQGHGLGKAVMRGVMHLAFQELGLRRLWAQVLGTNERAQRLFTSVGFVQEACLREHVLSDGKLTDMVMLGLNRG